MTAVILGLVVAGALALRAIARTTRVEEVTLDHGHHAEERGLLAEHIVAYHLDGPLFFAAAHSFLLELTEIADVRVVVLRLSRVSTIDATGALVLHDVVERPDFRLHTRGHRARPDVAARSAPVAHAGQAPRPSSTVASTSSPTTSTGQCAW